MTLGLALHASKQSGVRPSSSENNLWWPTYIGWTSYRCAEDEKSFTRESKLSIVSSAVRLLFESPAPNSWTHVPSKIWWLRMILFLYKNRIWAWKANHLVIARNTRRPRDNVQCANILWVWLHVCGCGYVCIDTYPLLGAHYLTIYGNKRMHLLTRFYGNWFLVWGYRCGQVLGGRSIEQVRLITRFYGRYI